MSIEVWPFLVSRNRYLDYRTVVAPDFICAAKTGNLLARVTTGDLTEPGKGFIRQIFGSKVGDFTIVYRILKATQKDLNSPQAGDEILKDQFGREILLIEGVVIQEVKSQENVLISQKNIEEVHEKLTAGYTEFWEHRDPHPAISSDRLFLSIDGSNSPLQLEEIEAFRVELPISNINEEKKWITFIKSWANNVNYVIVFTIILAGMVVVGWRYLGNYGEGKVYDCTTTADEMIILDSKKDINNVLNDLKEEYPNATIFLNAELILKSNKQWQYLTTREEVNELQNYTINLNANILKLQDHPLDLAIAQLQRRKPQIVEATIRAKIINRKECI